jgi:hypothetical protein
MTPGQESGFFRFRSGPTSAGPRTCTSFAREPGRGRLRHRSQSLTTDWVRPQRRASSACVSPAASRGGRSRTAKGPAASPGRLDRKCPAAPGRDPGPRQARLGSRGRKRWRQGIAECLVGRLLADPESPADLREGQAPPPQFGNLLPVCPVSVFALSGHRVPLDQPSIVPAATSCYRDSAAAAGLSGPNVPPPRALRLPFTRPGRRDSELITHPRVRGKGNPMATCRLHGGRVGVVFS